MAHLIDSKIFGSSWATPELKALFDDKALVRDWLKIMSVLAETQAEYQLIPNHAATGIKQCIDNLVLDEAFFGEVEQGFRDTNHSLLGLIQAVNKACPDDSGEWLCYGATVQDITDTRMVLILKHFHNCISHHLANIDDVLIRHCLEHRDTLMCGRTHGQHGLPITFGYKVAGWLDEFHRHSQRLAEILPRLSYGQLAGGVGSLSSLGVHAIEIQRSFCTRLGLSVPSVSWTSSRDRIVEWVNLLALIASTCDRIANEVYNLQRPEIDELREGFVEGNVGSITMPQKRNPELSEHIGTLARIVRNSATQMNEIMVQDHERDGKAWKTEWIVFPEACLAAEKAINLSFQLLSHLSVNVDRMRSNIFSYNDFIFAEAVMLAMAPTLGKQSAHIQVYDLIVKAKKDNIKFKQALLADNTVSKLLGHKKIETIFEVDKLTSYCGVMVDQVLNKVKYEKNV